VDKSQAVGIIWGFLVYCFWFLVGSITVANSTLILGGLTI